MMHKPVIRDVVYDGYEYGLLFSYVEGLSAILRTYKAQFQRDKAKSYYQYWRISKVILDQNVEALLQSIAYLVGEKAAPSLSAFMETLSNARLSPNRAAFVANLHIKLYPISKNAVIVSSGYHQGLISLVKNMGGRYLAPAKAWKLTCTSPVFVAESIVANLNVNIDQIEILDGEYEVLDAGFKKIPNPDGVGITVSSAADINAVASLDEDVENKIYLALTSPLVTREYSEEEIARLLSVYELYDYQREGVVHLITKNSALLADDMGTGKTRQSIVAAHIAANGGKKIVLCPACTILNWVNEVKKIFPDAKISTKRFCETDEWFIVNYDRLESVVDQASLFSVMIIDEAQYIKEPESQRTRFAFEMASKIPNRYLLTGTPIMNRESEIHTLLRLSGHSLGNVALRDFVSEFSGNQEFRGELRKNISSWMLRRRKDDVLKTLKGKRRQLVPIEMDVAKQDEYVKVATDPTMGALPKITKLRQLLEEMKLDYIADSIMQLEKEDKALVFCEYTESVSKLMTILRSSGVGCVSITGADSPEKRKRAEIALMEEDEIQVLIGTTKAAGVGINLTAANYVFFASLPWTPALRDQAEDRAYRNGQLRVVFVKVPIVSGTIDMEIWDLIEHKSTVANDILDPHKIEALSSLMMNSFSGGGWEISPP